MSKIKELQEVYKSITEKVDRSDVKRVASKSDSDITNTDTKEFVRELASDTASLKKLLLKAATLNEKTPELEMFVVSFMNLKKVLEDKKNLEVK